MTTQSTTRKKSKFDLFSIHNGEAVTGVIINPYLAKIIYEDGTSIHLHLSYTTNDEDELDLVEYHEDMPYEFTIANFIQEGFVPQGYLRIQDQPTPTQALIDKINEVLAQTQYQWSAKDTVTLIEIPISQMINNMWQNTTQLHVKVNGLKFGKTTM